VLLGGTVLQLLLLGRVARGEPVTHAFSRSLLSASLAGHDGHALVARIMLLALVAAVGEQVLRHRVAGGVVAAVGALLLALTWSETGRAAGDGLALAVTTLHVTAMAVWTGGTATVAVLLARRVPDAGMDAAVGRFSRLTLWCVAAMAATGVYLAHRATGLGDLLPAEAGLFLLLAAAAGRRKSRRLAPAALRRSVLLELAGLTAVVVLGALLAGTPPPGR
jgi:copper transport protein